MGWGHTPPPPKFGQHLVQNVEKKNSNNVKILSDAIILIGTLVSFILFS